MYKHYVEKATDFFHIMSKGIDILKLVEEIELRQDGHIVFVHKDLTAKAYSESISILTTPDPTKARLQCRGVHKGIPVVVSLVCLEGVAETGFGSEYHCACFV